MFGVGARGFETCALVVLGTLIAQLYVPTAQLVGRFGDRYKVHRHFLVVVVSTTRSLASRSVFVQSQEMA